MVRSILGLRWAGNPGKCRAGTHLAAIFCPITSRVKGCPFEVPLPAGLAVGGVVLSDQVKSLDWRTREAQFICRLPATATAEVLEKLGTLLLA
jgi:mRNA interferase MazF